MSVREYLNNNSAVATIAAVVILVIALGILVWSNKGPSSGSTQVYFYDLNEQKLLVAPASTQSPFETESGDFAYPPGLGPGPAGVMAFVYACESCDGIEAGMSAVEVEAAGGEIAYVSRYSLEAIEARKKMESGEQVDPMQMMALAGPLDQGGMLYALPDGQFWVTEMSNEGRAFMSSVSTLCSGSNVKFCRP